MASFPTVLRAQRANASCRIEMARASRCLAHSYQILAFSVGLTALLVMGESWAVDAPKYDYRTEQSFEVGGKEFIGPKKYWTLSGAAFYWPSRSPAYVNTGIPEDELRLIREGKFSQVAIELFIEVGNR